MENGFITLVALIVVLVILYAISYYPAKWMVKKHILLGSKFWINTDQENPQKIEIMKKVAYATLTKNNIPIELFENENYAISLAVEEGKISKVKVESNLAKLYVFDDSDGGKSVEVEQKKFDQKSATIVTAMLLAALLLLVITIVEMM